MPSPSRVVTERRPNRQFHGKSLTDLPMCRSAELAHRHAGFAPRPWKSDASEYRICTADRADCLEMARPYLILPLVEHTHAWWEWRRFGIGSADAATILGESRGKSVEHLLAAKAQPAKATARRFEQDRSATQERKAREHYCRTNNRVIIPTCVQSLARPWQRASLDGLTADGHRAVEIKCGKATYATVAARRKPARQHFAQLQHIMAVTGLPAVDYWCYSSSQPALLLEVERDERYIDRLIAAEEIFWRRLAPSLGIAVPV